ncbi:AAA family ATPase [Olsenella sp. Marseille-P4559]|uniref:AAA family ATPase n=1 Tax=Olsenella sp. Marseille-P4559 TaxID=2364795 RepID=UPI001031CC4D|nr:AAA family ATPase [Olsenella sp. Marseille-P4559]
MESLPDMEGGASSGNGGFSALFSPLPAERQELPPVLIENTLRKGSVMLIGAAPKVGKTFLTAQMVVAFAMGTAVLGFSFTRCERILVVNTEMGAAEYDNRIIDAALSPEVAREVSRRVLIAHTDDDPELTVKDVAEAICVSDCRPDVVIIDPIYPLFMGNENSNEDAKATLAYLKMVASRTGAGVIYTHHFSKGAQDLKEARDRVSGAGTLGRNYAALWALTELAPGEEEMSDLPDGSVAVRIATDLRSFKRSKANRNLDFNAVRMDGLFFRDDDGRFDKAPTREAARLAKARGKIKELLDQNGGEPVEFSTVQRLTALSPNTIKDYLIEMDEYQLVRMRVGGRGQSRNHIAWASWQPTLGTELIPVGGDDNG